MLYHLSLLNCCYSFNLIFQNCSREEIKRLVRNLDESKDEVKVLREEIAMLESKVESQKDLISNRRLTRFYIGFINKGQILY